MWSDLGFTTVRYQGPAKNAHRLIVTCVLASLFMVRRRQSLEPLPGARNARSPMTWILVSRISCIHQ